MHSRIPKQKDRYLYCMHIHIFLVMKKNPNFFYGPTQNDIKKVQWNEMQHLHVLPFYPEKVF